MELSTELQLDAAQLGQMSRSAIWFAVFALAQFPVGVALDRFGPRRTISLAMMLAVIGAGLFAAAQSFAACLVAMALIGAGCAPVLMGGMYHFGRTEPPGRFAMLASMLIGLGTLGNLAGAAPLAHAVAAFGWRPSMAGIAALTAGSCVLTYALLRDPPRIVNADGSSGGLIEGFRELLSMPVLWLMAPLVTLSYAVVIAVRSLWIAPFFGQVHQYDAVARGNAALVMAAAMSAGALAYGLLERWIGSAKATTLAGSLITGVAFLALGTWGDNSASTALVCVAIIGAAGMTYGILMAHARMFFPAALLGRGVTFVNFLFIARRGRAAGGVRPVRAVAHGGGRAAGRNLWRVAPDLRRAAAGRVRSLRSRPGEAGADGDLMGRVAGPAVGV